VELGSIGDVELGEHPAEVIADGPVADKQLLADLPVRQAIRGQARDLRLPHSQVAAKATVARSFSEGLAGGGKLPRRAIGECDCSDRVKHLAGDAQLLPRIDPAAFAPKPFPVEEMRTGQLDRLAGALQMADRSAIETLSGLAVAPPAAAPLAGGLEIPRSSGWRG